MPNMCHLHQRDQYHNVFSSMMKRSVGSSHEVKHMCFKSFTDIVKQFLTFFMVQPVCCNLILIMGQMKPLTFCPINLRCSFWLNKI